jgi:membrane glycosyltransferase
VTRETTASRLCGQYLDRLPLPEEVRRNLEASIAAEGDQLAPEAAMARLHRALAQHEGVLNPPGVPAHDAEQASPAYASVTARLLLRYGRAALESYPFRRRAGPSRPTLVTASHGHAAGHGVEPELNVAPPLNRSSMTPHPWGILNPVRRWLATSTRRPESWKPRKSPGKARKPWPAPAPEPLDMETKAEAEADEDVVDAPDPRGRWQHLGNIRRLVLLVLMLGQTGVATYFMSQVLPYQGKTPLEIATLALFAILFCWVSAGFWTAMTGFLVLIRGNDRFSISHLDQPDAPISPAARTAIVMPICNEDVTRVMAGLRATYESVARTGDLQRFDFFILSDSSESDNCAAELAAWAELCDAVDGYGRIFYRRRHRRVKRKSGNIDDFCRRWAKDYRYMLVLDADSVMSGSCLTTLVRMMEANPGAGIIQTAPRAAGRDTLYARIQQFSTSVYGPLFTAGLHYWQLGESHYWGHNAIIRLAPFVRHCALAPLPGRGSLAGEILSHDFVEAALMRRAGWAVWIAYDLDGSYEEMPPNLLDELKRDRRWCHGNLMNFRLFPARGMHRVHRAVFVTGVMAYLSAPLWFLFLALSTAMLALHTLVEPEYFVEPRQLFPIWPQWDPEKAIGLFTATVTLLFLPKILSVLLIWAHGAGRYGGKLRLFGSMLIELLFSMVLAPVRMLFHTKFVVASFLGWAIRWKSPPREDSQTTWGEGFRKHGLHTLIGIAWGAGVYWLNPAFLPWLLPIAGALALSIPVSVFSSRVSFGRAFRRARLFAIPEEVEPPVELRETAAHVNAAPCEAGFIDAVVDPVTNAIASAAGRVTIGLRALRGLVPGLREKRELLLLTALREDPEKLDEKHRLALLRDAMLLSELHFRVWTSEEAHATWRGLTNTTRKYKDTLEGVV